MQSVKQVSEKDIFLSWNENGNNNKNIEELTSDAMYSFNDSIRIKSYKQLSQNRNARCKYLLKPTGILLVSVGLMCVGIALTVYHFMYEDSLAGPVTTLPYFTYGPISFATGVVLFMIGLVWFSVKYHKWTTGKASPIASAAVAALVTSATITSEQLGAERGVLKDVSPPNKQSV